MNYIHILFPRCQLLPDDHRSNQMEEALDVTGAHGPRDAVGEGVAWFPLPRQLLLVHI